MSRLARVVVPDLLHHVTQRGNVRARTIFGDGDGLRRARSKLHRAYAGVNLARLETQTGRSLKRQKRGAEFEENEERRPVDVTPG